MLVGVAIGLLVLIAAPSLSRFIDLQRLRSINAALVTDIQLCAPRPPAATSRSRSFQGNGSSMTCYAVVSGDHTLCDCTQSPGGICCSGSAARDPDRPGPARHRHHRRRSSVAIKDLRFDPATGRVEIFTADDWYPPTAPSSRRGATPRSAPRTAIEATAVHTCSLAAPCREFRHAHEHLRIGTSPRSAGLLSRRIDGRHRRCRHTCRRCGGAGHDQLS
jgi:hypothetical protein